MKLREHEAKTILKAAGIPVPAGFLIRSADELTPRLGELGDAFVLKAQVEKQNKQMTWVYIIGALIGVLAAVK